MSRPSRSRSDDAGALVPLGRRAPVSADQLGATSPPAAPPPPLLDVADLIHVLRRRWRAVALVALLGVAAGALAASRVPAWYAASAVLRVVDSRRALAGDLVAARVPDDPMRVDPVLTQIQVLLSRATARQALAMPGGEWLRLRPSFPLDLLAAVRLDSAADSIALRFEATEVVAERAGRTATAGYGTPLELGGAVLVVRRPPAVRTGQLQVLAPDAAVNALLRATTARRREGTDVVDVTVTAPTAELARRSVNQLVTAFAEGNVEASRLRSRERREFIAQQLALADERFRAARDSLASFESGLPFVLAPAGTPIGATNPFAGAGAELEAARADAAREGTAARTLLARLRARPRPLAEALLLIEAAGPLGAAVQRATDNLIRYQQQRDSLTRTGTLLTATHPLVVALDARVAATLRGLDSALVQHAAAVDDRVAELDRRLAGERRLQQAIPHAQAERTRLLAEQESFARLAQQLQEEQQRARIAEAAESGQIDIVDLATVGAPTRSNARVQLLLFGGGAGALAGLGLALLRERLDTSVRRQTDLDDRLAVSALGVVPALPMRHRSGDTAARLLPPPPTTPTASRFRPAARQALRARAGLEAFHHLCIDLLAATPDGPPRTVAVTSALPDEGKTTVACNLARALAESGVRVLLVDGDVRRPQLHRAFGLEPAPGLGDVLRDAAAIGAAVRDSGIPGLAVLPAGTATVAPLRLPRIHEVLARLAVDHDVIVVDTPPVLVAADAGPLATACERVLFVVRAGRTGEADARDALRRLDRLGAQLFGAVLNDPDQQAQERRADHYGYYATAVGGVG